VIALELAESAACDMHVLPTSSIQSEYYLDMHVSSSSFAFMYPILPTSSIQLDCYLLFYSQTMLVQILY